MSLLIAPSPLAGTSVVAPGFLLLEVAPQWLALWRGDILQGCDLQSELSSQGGRLGQGVRGAWWTGAASPTQGCTLTAGAACCCPVPYSEHPISEKPERL